MAQNFGHTYRNVTYKGEQLVQMIPNEATANMISILNGGVENPTLLYRTKEEALHPETFSPVVVTGNGEIRSEGVKVGEVSEIIPVEEVTA